MQQFQKAPASYTAQGQGQANILGGPMIANAQGGGGHPSQQQMGGPSSKDILRMQLQDQIEEKRQRQMMEKHGRRSGQNSAQGMGNIGFNASENKSQSRNGGRRGFQVAGKHQLASPYATEANPQGGPAPSRHIVTEDMEAYGGRGQTLPPQQYAEHPQPTAHHPSMDMYQPREQMGAGDHLPPQGYMQQPPTNPQQLPPQSQGTLHHTKRGTYPRQHLPAHGSQRKPSQLPPKKVGRSHGQWGQKTSPPYERTRPCLAIDGEEKRQ